MRIIGIFLIICGVLALVYGGFSYTRQEKVLDLGPIEATAEKTTTVPIAPILGIVVLLGGVLMVVAGARASKG